MSKEKTDTASSRPFQLRPSILSSSGFGNPFSSSNATSAEKQKGFIMRPSSLTSAADKLESLHKSETRKRPLDGTDDAIAKPEQEESKKTKIAEETPRINDIPNPSDDIKKPTGIGSFGFAANHKNNEATASGNTSPQAKANYFQKGLNSNSDKLTFGFTASTNTSFSSIKSNNNTENMNSGDKESASDSEVDSTNKEQLLENAKEYQKTHNQRTHFEEVEQFTGEEGEQHVLQVCCKLHLFDKKDKRWLEKGRGTLRLNDICQSEGVFQSRLVFRTQGTNLVMLNTKLWAEMSCETVKDKSIRITAMDPQSKEVKVYLITTSLKDTLQVYTSIDRRIEALKRNREKFPKNDDTPSSNESKSRTDDDDSSNELETRRLRARPSEENTDEDSKDDP